ncbi:hypothetical protein [Actibacterium lipolyticum]|uniref:Uncharacterized protein n=1 Tax=Actibacterium lipolyticum TaxID=1524263 RepID=A0A238JW15_9RHOB|nr:hypothetical protein [Actibacterium lipolyticum]SMX34387.1 hypothetical protein COL8621_01284 [Actibacterium lipolyticum]
MFENLRKLYVHYGGMKAIVKSSYFWVSVLLAVLSYQSIASYEWTDKAVSVMPSLTGFTIAAFAIIFAILDPEMLRKLVAADDQGRSPIAEIAASIGHAVFIQVSAMIIAISSKLVDLNTAVITAADWICSKGYSPKIFVCAIDWLAFSFSAIGLFFTYYGVMLVLAAILSIVRMQLIVAAATKSKPAKPTKKPSTPSPPPSQ